MSASELDFQKIYDEYQPKILRYLSRFIGESDAEDLTQETFVKVYQSLGSFRGEAGMVTWVYQIAPKNGLGGMR